jgi:hypothetical protein
MIGLSVSHCFAEMAQGIVNPASVSKVIGRTACRDEEDWEHVIERYRTSQWDAGYAYEAVRLVREFLSEGKIEQPRLTRRLVPDISDGIWVELENTIRYNPS